MRQVLALLALSMVMALVPAAAMAEGNAQGVPPQPVVTAPADDGTAVDTGSPVETPPSSVPVELQQNNK